LTLAVKEALAGMSVDVIQQLANGIKILLDSSNELEDKVNRSVNHQKINSNLLLLFIKPPTAGHHQLKGLKNIFRAIFFIYKLQY
jgi:hypothetical protein